MSSQSAPAPAVPELVVDENDDGVEDEEEEEDDENDEGVEDEEEEDDEDEEEEDDDDEEEENDDDDDEEEWKPNPRVFESAVWMRMDMIEAGNTKLVLDNDPSIMNTAEWQEAWRRHKIKPLSQRKQERQAASGGTAKGANPKKPKGNTPTSEPSPSASSSAGSSVPE